MNSIEDDTTTFTFQIPKSLKSEAETEANRLNMPLSVYIRLAIMEKLGKKAV
jgi:hypothetical protein